MLLTPRPYSLNNPAGMNFVRFTVVFWLDGFVRARYKEVFVQSLNYCITHKGLRVHAWYLMSSHAHLFISAQQPKKVNLSDIIRDMKKFTASQIIREYPGNRSWSGKPAGMAIR
jgi:putative transposase